MAISVTDIKSNPTTTTKPLCLSQLEVETVHCYTCGFTEDCTPAYISRVRERCHGRWLCGLCVEAVKDEAIRSDIHISTEEALNRHISFCNKFKSSSSSSSLSETEHPISVLGRVLRRSLDSPRARALRSNSASVLPDVDKINNGSSLVRSESCFSALSG